MSIIDKPIVKTLMLKGEKGDPGDLDSTAIVDNLTTNRADKVLSAKQGKVLKDLVDANKIVSDHGIINLNSALDLKANTADVASEYATVNDNISSLDAKVNSLDAKVNSLASGSPLVASSISDMTDTTRSYVLVTDGHWYYYDGDSWEDGGTYQSTGIADDSVSPIKTTFHKSSINKFDKDNPNILNATFTVGGMILDYSHPERYRTIYIPCNPNKGYKVKKIQSARFTVGFSANEPTVGGTTINSGVSDNSATEIKVFSPSTANYLLVYLYNRDHDTTITPEEIFNSLIIVEEYQSSDYIEHNIIEVKNENLNSNIVSPEKTTFSKTSRNLFDKDNPNIVYANIESTLVNYNTPNKFRTVYVPCEPNEIYTISKIQSARFTIGFTADEPAIGVNVYSRINNNSATSITKKSPSNANYLVAFIYNSDYDTTVTVKDIFNSLMIENSETKGSYVEHKIIEVNGDNLNDKCITPEKLSDSLLDELQINNNRFNSRNKIFGIKFDVTSSDPDCERIADAVGLKNDFVINSTYQLNNGVNDFDNVFPWCDIRLCNLKLDNNGKKIVTYQGENDFALDGSNGNVMVEIPKFYSMREKVGNDEIWAITGEAKSGFEVEPAFVVNGKELDYIYVSAYNSASLLQNKYYSYTNSIPTSGKSQPTYIQEFANVGLQSYDLSVFLLMQKLVTIEFGTRNVQKYLGGITLLPYCYSGSTENLIKDKGTNYVVITPSAEKAKNFYVGERVLVGGRENSFTNARYITAIETLANDNQKITYDGTDLSDSLVVNSDGLYGCPQKNGLCDDLIYHTGRTDFGNDSKKSYVNPFRYRYIENLWGNVWEYMSGFKVKDLKYYYSFVPNYNENVTENSEWKTLTYNPPLQPLLGETNKAWIVKNGYDINDKLLALPEVVGNENDGGDNKYFSDCFYSKNENPNYEYVAAVGGGWDHTIYAGIFTLRAYQPLTSTNWLYGNRAIYRG